MDRMRGGGVISIGCKIEHLVPLMVSANSTVHSSMLPMEDKDIVRILGANLNEMVGDFFSIEEGSLPDVSVALSQATIHCMNDTRYQNDSGLPLKSYLFAGKLLKICPNVRTVIVSVPVNEEEHIADNSSYLSDGKFIESFTSTGFKLVKTMYDKNCLTENVYEPNDRLSDDFPTVYCKSHKYVVGNYHFERA